MTTGITKKGIGDPVANMSESGAWSEDVIQAVRKYALQNSVEYNGQGKDGSVLGRLLSEMQELRPRAKELRELVQLHVENANRIASEEGIDAVRKILEESNPEALHREKQKKRVGLPELPNSCLLYTSDAADDTP